jgi:acylphosphatase
MQLHLYYSGNVQGIGFRYTVMAIADDLNVRGWVRNLRDGRVELFAQADQDALNAFLERINQRFSGYITETKTAEGQAYSSRQEGEDEPRGFQIRF